MTDNNHEVQALVLMCMDFRFHEQTLALLKKQGLESFDLKTDAGGVKYLVSADKPAVKDWILENISIAKRLHHIKSVFLINHYDCGAYGGNAAFESQDAQLDYHREQLTAARTILSNEFPDLEVKTMFARLSDGKVTLSEV